MPEFNTEYRNGRHSCFAKYFPLMDPLVDVGVYYDITVAMAAYSVTYM